MLKVTISAMIESRTVATSRSLEARARTSAWSGSSAKNAFRRAAMERGVVRARRCCQSAGKHALGSIVGERNLLCAIVRAVGCGQAWVFEWVEFGIVQTGRSGSRRSAPVRNRTLHIRCAINGGRGDLSTDSCQEVRRSTEPPQLGRSSLAPWHFLCFLPLPQGHGSLRPTFAAAFTGARAAGAAFSGR